MKKIIATLTAMLVQMSVYALAPTSLKTEFLENPLGINTTKTQFLWIAKDATPGAKQTAYEAQAASSSKKLPAGEADLWDSGKKNGYSKKMSIIFGKPIQNNPVVIEVDIDCICAIEGIEELDRKKYFIVSYDGQNYPNAFRETIKGQTFLSCCSKR